jgi:hypothetical protein
MLLIVAHDVIRTPAPFVTDIGISQVRGGQWKVKKGSIQKNKPKKTRLCKIPYIHQRLEISMTVYTDIEDRRPRQKRT